MKIRRGTFKDKEELKRMLYEEGLEAFMGEMPKELIDFSKSLGEGDIFDEMKFLGVPDDVFEEEELNVFFEDGYETFFIESGDKVIGFCHVGKRWDFTFGRSRENVEIYKIYVDKNYRSLGLGSKLIQHICELQKKAGFGIVSFFVENFGGENEILEPFLTKNGFSLTKRSFGKHLTGERYIVNCEVREALPEDYHGFSKLVIAMYQGFLKYDEDMYNGVKVQYSEEFYLNELEDDDKCMLVCEMDGRIVGICSAEIGDQVVLINTVSVDAEYKKRGIATALYSSIFNKVQREGIEEIEAVVFAQNEESCSFHEYMGMENWGSKYECTVG